LAADSPLFGRSPICPLAFLGVVEAIRRLLGVVISVKDGLLVPILFLLIERSK
jgi:hypothetical protein